MLHIRYPWHFYRSNIVVTFDGSCYISIHNIDTILSYDPNHINSIYRFSVHNRSASILTFDSISEIYNDSLFLPLLDDSESDTDLLENISYEAE